MIIIPIKKELRDLNYEELDTKRFQISWFLDSNPNVANAEQGYETLRVLRSLMKAKKSKNILMEEIIKTICFE